VALIGWASALLARGNDAKQAQTSVGILVSSACYYIHFDYWDTAQVEIWESLCLVSALVSVRNIRNLRLACRSSGVLVGVAFLFKFPSLLLVPLVALVTAQRIIIGTPAKQRLPALLSASALQLADATIPVILIVAAFAHWQALNDLHAVGLAKGKATGPAFHMGTLLDRFAGTAVGGSLGCCAREVLHVLLGNRVAI
jgi:hypothetical protein